MIKLLHVEEDADIREIALMSLNKSGGFNVEQCSWGEDALDRVKGYVPEVILLDMMMSGMTGKQTLELMRKILHLADVPAIFTTARAQLSDLDELRKIGASYTISKHFDPMTLADQSNLARLGG